MRPAPSVDSSPANRIRDRLRKDRGMATNVHFITCVNRSSTLFHQHVTRVGLGDALGYYRERISVEAVRTAIREGDRFYTVSPTTGKPASA